MRQLGWQIEVEHGLLKSGDRIRFARTAPGGKLEYAEGVFDVHSVEGKCIRFLGDIPAGIRADDLMELVLA